eukprot:scaffold15769_cov125-Isochrysis_galbana.AAC.2
MHRAARNTSLRNSPRGYRRVGVGARRPPSPRARRLCKRREIVAHPRFFSATLVRRQTPPHIDGTACLPSAQKPSRRTPLKSSQFLPKIFAKTKNLPSTFPVGTSGYCPRIATGLSDIGYRTPHTSEELSGKTIAPRLSLNSFF